MKFWNGNSAMLYLTDHEKGKGQEWGRTKEIWHRVKHSWLATNRTEKGEEKGILNHIQCLTTCPLSPLSDTIMWPTAATTHSFTRCYDLLNSGTLKYSSPAQWSTEAKFLPGIIKVNRILMGPGRLVKTLPGPGSAVLLLPLLLPNAVRLHIQAPAK